MEFNFDNNSAKYKNMFTLALKWLPWVLVVGLVFFLCFLLWLKPDTKPSEVKRELNKAEIAEIQKENALLLIETLRMKDALDEMKRKGKNFEFYNEKSKRVYENEVDSFRHTDDSSRLYKSARAIIEFEFD